MWLMVKPSTPKDYLIVLIETFVSMKNNSYSAKSKLLQHINQRDATFKALTEV